MVFRKRVQLSINLKLSTMKKHFVPYSFLFLLSACNTSTNQDKPLDKDNILQQVKSTEANLFNLLKKGNIEQAFALHDNQQSYKNIADGYTRTYTQMDSVLKANSSKGLKSYDYEIQNRDFIVIDNKTTLETIEGTRIVKDTANAIIEKRAVTMSLLWTKTNDMWKLGYLHSSYKN